MTAEDDFYEDDEPESHGGGEGEGGESGGPAQPVGLRNWLAGRRGWVALVAVTLLQGIFAVVMLAMRSDARPVTEIQSASIRDLAIEMLGHEVRVGQVYQLIPAPGGKRMTIGLDIVLVLGQLPAEQVEGAPRPTPEEFAAFTEAITFMETRIRSQVNVLLQSIPARDYGRVEVYKTIKDAVKDYINDSLEGLDFSKTVRPEIEKRRVTDVLLPMFIRQML